MPAFSCPGCKQLYEYAESDSGRPFVCPHCRTSGHLPRGEETESPTLPDQAEWHATCPRCSSLIPLALRSMNCWVCCPVCQLFFVATQSATPPPIVPSAMSRPLAVRTSSRSLIGGLLLAGGIWAILYSLLAVFASVFICCLWPGVYLALVWGILAIIRGSEIMHAKYQGPPPTALIILQVVLIINGDVINLILGIINLVHLGKW